MELGIVSFNPDTGYYINKKEWYVLAKSRESNDSIWVI
jgi:hypothetical protein